MSRAKSPKMNIVGAGDSRLPSPAGPRSQAHSAAEARLCWTADPAGEGRRGMVPELAFLSAVGERALGGWRAYTLKALRAQERRDGVLAVNRP